LYPLVVNYGFVQLYLLATAQNVVVQDSKYRQLSIIWGQINWFVD